MTNSPAAAVKAATDRFPAVGLHVVRPHAAGCDAHKTATTATLRGCGPGPGRLRRATREVSDLPKGLCVIAMPTAAAIESGRPLPDNTAVQRAIVRGCPPRQTAPGRWVGTSIAGRARRLTATH